MAIVVLVLWLFTVGAGFYLLVTSNLGRSHPAPPAAATSPAATAAAAASLVTPTSPAAPAAASLVTPTAAPSAAAATTSAGAASVATATEAPAAATATTATPAASAAALAAQAAAASPASPVAAAEPGRVASGREMRRAARDRFDPPSLTAAKNAPMMPGLRPLLEFAHPAFAVIGLGFWLGFTLVHNRALGWIAFGLVTATVCLGLTWFAASTRAASTRAARNPDAARNADPAGDEPAPSFSIRLVALHGGAAAVTFTLAALAALVLSR